MNPNHTIIKILALLNDEHRRAYESVDNAEYYYPENKEELLVLKGREREADHIRYKITRLIMEELEGGETH